MSSSLQTILALAIVAVTVALLLRSMLGKRGSSGCGGSCGAVSPEIMKLQARLKK
ncbi:MAG: FeoB-associated Cys-rich membrane protein [Verrucomicrobiota bacterium]